MKNLKKLFVITFLIVNCQLSIYPVKHLPRKLKLFRGYLNFITILLTLILFNGVVNCFAQSIGINEPNPDNSAILEMTSTERGLLIPRMTTAHRDAIASPSQSLLIFNTDELCYQGYVGGQWNDIWCHCIPPAITTHPSDVSISDGDNASFSVLATGTAPLSYQWQESTDGGTTWNDISNGGANPAYSGATTNSLILTNVPTAYDTYDYQCVITNACGSVISNAATITIVACVTQTHCGILYTYCEVTNPITGKIWLDRNLGASQVATSYTDYLAYGSLYQWGRLSDGHECITWTNSTTGTPDNGTTTTLSSTDDPGHSSFIIGASTPFDWISPQNDNLWQGLGGTNNPCPAGYRLPTNTELDNERATWSSQDCNGAYASPLKLVAAGLRNFNDATFANTGNRGGYWSSTVNSVTSDYLNFDNSGGTIMGNYSRANGFSVRCIKD